MRQSSNFCIFTGIEMGEVSCVHCGDRFRTSFPGTRRSCSGCRDLEIAADRADSPEPDESVCVVRPRPVVTKVCGCGTKMVDVTRNRRYCDECNRERRRVVNSKRLLDIQGFGEVKVSLGCSICGYRKSSRALSFHHTGKKRFPISASRFLTVGPTPIMEEIAGCVLLCSNCHMEVHGGVADCPAQIGKVGAESIVSDVRSKIGKANPEK